jgi:hypothetical protein
MDQRGEFLGGLHPGQQRDLSAVRKTLGGCNALGETQLDVFPSTNLNSRSRYPLTSPLTSVRVASSLPSVCVMSYLVICGRASARSMDSACRCTSR